MQGKWLITGLLSAGLCVLTFQNCSSKLSSALGDSTGAATRIPSPTQFRTNEANVPTGQVSGGSMSVLYDPAADTECQAVLDAQIIPMSSAGDGGSTAVSFVASKFENDGRLSSVNVWGKTEGDEFRSFKVACGSVLKSPMTDNPLRGAQWIIARFKDVDQNVHAILHGEYYGGGYPGFRTFAAADQSLPEQRGR